MPRKHFVLFIYCDTPHNSHRVQQCQCFSLFVCAALNVKASGVLKLPLRIASASRHSLLVFYSKRMQIRSWLHSSCGVDILIISYSKLVPISLLAALLLLCWFLIEVSYKPDGIPLWRPSASSTHFLFNLDSKLIRSLSVVRLLLHFIFPIQLLSQINELPLLISLRRASQNHSFHKCK